MVMDPSLSDLESDVSDSLSDLSLPLPPDFSLSSYVSSGMSSPCLPGLVSSLVTELSSISLAGGPGEPLAPQPGPGEAGQESWLMELSSSLRELGCPLKSITEGPVASRLSTPRDRLILLDWLSAELMAARQVNCYST